MSARSQDEYDTRHPHEPEIPPAFDAEGRCLVCKLSVRIEDLEAALMRIEDAARDALSVSPRGSGG